MYKDIDEAIKQLTENYNFWMQFACDDCLEEGEHKVNNCEENANSCYQIIRWLEELKAFRKNKTFKIGKDSHSWEVGYDKGYEKGRQDVIDKINNLKKQYVDACNMCTKTECDVCAISNFIEDLEMLKESKE